MATKTKTPPPKPSKAAPAPSTRPKASKAVPGKGDPTLTPPGLKIPEYLFPRPEPFRGFCVFNSKGRPNCNTLRGSSESSIEFFVQTMTTASQQRKQDFVKHYWAEFQTQGYRCLPIKMEIV